MPSTVPCCPVSQEPYEADGPNKPRSLPCGHSISHASLEAILNQEDADRRLCPIDRTPLTQASADAYPVNFAIVEVIGALPAGDTADLNPPPAHAGAHPTLPAFPLQGAPLGGASASDLSFAEVLPGGTAEGITDEVWHRIERAYKLPRSTVDGNPADWDVLGWTSSGHCAYRGFNKSTPGMPSAVALCYAATLQSTDSRAAHAPVSQHAQHESNRRALRAAIAPHVALQLLPDVRPLLPTLHGYVLKAADAALGAAQDDGADSSRPAGDRQTWLAYSLQGNCLAQHLEEQPAHYLPLKSVIAMFRQLASALEAMHRNRLTTSILYPLSIASVRLDTVNAASPVRIAPYAREIPASEVGYSSAGAFETLCMPPETLRGGGVPDAAAGDVWRAAAVAGVALAGDVLIEAIDGGATTTPAMLVGAVQKLREDPARLPQELADILEGCLHHDPNQRWTAEHMHAALLTESLDGVGETAPLPPPRPAPRQPPRPPQGPPPPHVVIAMPLTADGGGVADSQGQRPTPQTRSVCELCLVKMCYCIAIFFTVCITIVVVSAIAS